MSAACFRLVFCRFLSKSYRNPSDFSCVIGNVAARRFLHKHSSNWNISSLKSTQHASSILSSICFRDRNNIYNINQRHMAGHAKWQNIKHIKAFKDSQKTKLCSKFARLVQIAVREGGADIKLNTKLADVIANAKKNNVPYSSLEGAMKKPSGGKLKSDMIEIFGPGGCFVILEYETDNVSTTRGEIKYILKKHGSVIPQGEGRWRAVFERKGILKVIGHANDEPLNAEKALDSAIEAGAEDVQLKTDEGEEKAHLEFFCAPDDLHAVKKELETMLYKIEEAYVAYIPNVMVELTQEDMEMVSSMLSELEDRPDVVRLYENIQ